MWFVYQPTEDGRIVPCRVADNGEQIPIPGAAVTADPLSVTLTAHPSGRFLYASTRFVEERDAYNTSAPRPRRPDREKSFVRVYRVAADGRLSLSQIVPVKGILGKPLVHPNGRIFRAERAEDGYFAFPIRPDGTLAAPRLVAEFPSFYLTYSSGIVDISELAFAPDGRTAYVSHDWALLDVSGANLQFFRIAADGVLRKQGEAWAVRDGDPPSNSVQKDPGPVTYSPDGKTILLSGRSRTLYHCPTDAAGRIRAEKAVRYPIPTSRGERPVPFFRRQRSGEWRLYAVIHEGKGFSLYHLPAPGKAVKTASFGTGEYSDCLWTMNGRLLYETFALHDLKTQRYLGSKITAFRLDEEGRVAPASGLRPLVAYDSTALVFVERQGES